RRACFGVFGVAPKVAKPEQDCSQGVFRDRNRVGGGSTGECDIALPESVGREIARGARAIKNRPKIGGGCEEGCVHSGSTPTGENHFGFRQWRRIIPDAFARLEWRDDGYVARYIPLFGLAVDERERLCLQKIESFESFHYVCA